MKMCLNCMEEIGDFQDICPFCKYDIQKDVPSESNEIKPGEILNNRYVVGKVLDRKKSQIRYIGKDAQLQRIVQIVEYFPEDYLQRDGSAKLIFKSGVDGNTYKNKMKSFYDYYNQIMLLYKEREVSDIYSCFYHNNTCYAIEQYIKSNTYESSINENKPLEIVAALDLFGKAMRSVAKLHHEGIYHGNVKASSFIFGATADDVIVKDFYPRINLQVGEAQLEDRRSLVNLFGCMALGQTDVMEIDVKNLINSDKTVLSNKVKQEMLSMYERESLDKSLDMIFRDIFDDSRTINQKPDSKTKKTAAKSSRLLKRKTDSNDSKNTVKKTLVIALAVMGATGYFITRKSKLFPKENVVESSSQKSNTKESSTEKSTTKDSITQESSTNATEQSTTKAQEASTVTREKNKDKENSTDSTPKKEDSTKNKDENSNDGKKKSTVSDKNSSETTKASKSKSVETAKATEAINTEAAKATEAKSSDTEKATEAKSSDTEKATEATSTDTAKATDTSTTESNDEKKNTEEVIGDAAAATVEPFPDKISEGPK